MRVITGIVLAVSLGCGAYGQAAKPKPSFEVASVRAAAPPEMGGGGRIMFRMGRSGGPGTKDPTRITFDNASLFMLLTEAYDVRPYQINGPNWLNEARFDVKAKVPEGATKEEYRLMLQSLLEERFKLTLHHDTKELPIYELVVAKGGHKLKESDPEPPASEDAPPAFPPPGLRGGPPQLDKDGYPVLPPGMRGGMMVMNGRARMRESRTTMADFAQRLSNQVGRPVIDGTGLKGKYDFVLSFAPERMGGMDGGRGVMIMAGPGGGMPPPPAAVGGAGAGAGDGGADLAPGPTIFAAIQSDLGLKLESKKGPVDHLVIDHCEKVPTEN